MTTRFVFGDHAAEGFRVFQGLENFLAAEPGQLVPEPVALEMTVNQRHQLFAVEGLHEVVACPAVHGANGGGDVVHGADDDAVGLRPLLLDLLQHLHAAEQGHHQVQKHELEAVQAHELSHPAAVGDEGRFGEPGADQGGFDAEQQALVIIHYQDRRVFPWNRFHKEKSLSVREMPTVSVSANSFILDRNRAPVKRRAAGNRLKTL